MYKFIIDKIISERRKNDKIYSSIFSPFDYKNPTGFVSAYNYIYKTLIEKNSKEYFKITGPQYGDIANKIIDGTAVYNDVYNTMIHILQYNDTDKIVPINDELDDERIDYVTEELATKYEYCRCGNNDYLDINEGIGLVNIFALSKKEIYDKFHISTKMDYVFCMHEVDKHFVLNSRDYITQDIHHAKWPENPEVSYENFKRLRNHLCTGQKIYDYTFERLFFQDTIISFLSVLVLLEKTKTIKSNKTIKNIIYYLSKIGSPYTRLIVWEETLKYALKPFTASLDDKKLTMADKIAYVRKSKKEKEFLAFIESTLGDCMYFWDILLAEERFQMFRSSTISIADDMLFSLLEGMYFYNEFKTGSYTEDNYLNKRKEFLEIDKSALVKLMQQLCKLLENANNLNPCSNYTFDKSVHDAGIKWLNTIDGKLYGEIFLEFSKHLA